MMRRVIGLTGGIATGKSTISKMFKSFHIPVIDADKIAREVVEPGKTAYDHIVRTFGKGITQGDGTIDRKKLGQIIFSDERKRKQLNEIVHPAIRRKMIDRRDEYLKQGERAVVLDIPLLFESDLTHFVDQIIVVYIPETLQLERLLKRDHLNKVDALKRIRAQLPIEEKVKKADAVIDNQGSIEESFEQLEKILIDWNIIEGSSSFE